MTDEYYRQSDDPGILNDEPSGEGDQLTYRNHSEEIEPRHFAEAGEGDPPLSAGSATRTGDPAGINPDHIQKSRREDESS